MDGKFLAQAKCYFGGGTQLALAHGEFRESRDIDFLVSGSVARREERAAEHAGPAPIGLAVSQQGHQRCRSGHLRHRESPSSGDPRCNAADGLE
jgi:hypothetical protein